MCLDQMFATFSVTFVVIGNCIEETNCLQTLEINDFKSLRFKLLCKSYPHINGCFLHTIKYRLELILDLCSSFFLELIYEV